MLPEVVPPHNNQLRSACPWKGSAASASAAAAVGSAAAPAGVPAARADPLLTDCRPATTGFQPSPPYWNGASSGPPGLLLSRRYQVVVPGSITPTVVTPSPSQSPVTR